MPTKPTASLSLDIDNQWSYMKTHGDPGWESFPSYLDLVVPRILAILRELDLRITFFVVGQDAALEKNHAALKSLTAAGHEVGNHSFNHEPWLQRYTAQQIDDEIAQAEAIIEEVTGCKPVGFRGPGFSISDDAIGVLIQRGYLFDASTLPTYIGPLARLYYFMTASLKPEEKSKRDNLFGSISDGFRPVRPHFWHLPGGDQKLLEIPVTTMPVFKIPFHVSYIIYIATYSPALALLYFRFALWMCRITGTPPSLLLHPLDFLGCDDIRELAFFPAMNMPAEKKLGLVRKILGIYTGQFNVTSMNSFARSTASPANSSALKPVP